MSHNIEGLRQRLFDAIDGVRAGTLDIDKAKMISDLSQVIVNTAKVEADYLRACGGDSSRFLAPPSIEDTVEGIRPPPNNGILGVRRHLLKDD